MLSTYDKIDALVVQKGFVVVQNKGKESQKKRAAREKFVFLLIRSTDLDPIFIAVPV